MRNVSDAQRLKIRAAMIEKVLEMNGVDLHEQIGGKRTMKQAARQAALETLLDFAVQASGAEMEMKLHEMGGDQEAVWRWFCQNLLHEEPDGEEQPRVVAATPADAQSVINQSIAFRERVEGRKPNA